MDGSFLCILVDLRTSSFVDVAFLACIDLAYSILYSFDFVKMVAYLGIASFGWPLASLDTSLAFTFGAYAV